MQKFILCYTDGTVEHVTSDGVQFHPNGMITFYNGKPPQGSIVMNVGPAAWRWIKDDPAKIVPVPRPALVS